MRFTGTTMPIFLPTNVAVRQHPEGIMNRTVSEYVAATPAERAAMAREQGWQTRRTPTHRGKPRPWAIAGYHAAMQKLRTPTHRGEPRNG